MAPEHIADVLAPPAANGAAATQNGSRSSGSGAKHVYANDIHITGYQPLISPALLLHETPVTEAAKTTIARARAESSAVISGMDDRLLVVVGPCSIHNVDAALEYGERLKQLIPQLPELVVVMRAYFESEYTRASDWANVRATGWVVERAC